MSLLHVGTGLVPSKITMNGQTVRVLQNLRAALAAIRDIEKPRMIWIDALCINQADVDERSKQVAIMDKIYHRATKVLVWLGEAADDSHLLFGHEIPRDDWGLEWGGRRDRRYAEAMLALDSRPYWRRVWIIQEVLLARSLDLLCGTKRMSLDEYRRTFRSLLNKLGKLTGDGMDILQRRLGESPGMTILHRQSGGNTEDF
ncbi:HET-domain-containing protein [Stipitochalara longipes BDJ]|nr:HET-domain-containing protein [Stipitochalara longipes BDJ]